jgi:hypothetical protein
MNRFRLALALFALAACTKEPSPPPAISGPPVASEPGVPATPPTEIACDARAVGAHNCISQSCADVPAEWTACDSASDCRQVSLATCECDAEGRTIAVHEDYERQAWERFRSRDGDPNCDCTCGEMPLACVAGHCGFVLP